MREFRFVITPFCNYKCFFCHSENVDQKVSLLLKTSDYIFLGQVGKERFNWDTTTITGGEPLISPIFKSVCSGLKELGISITVVTNGSLLARPKEMLKDISQINVSLHTMSPEIYSRIVGVQYPLANILNTIVTTRAYLPDIKIHLNYTVIRGLNDSVSDFEKLLCFARKLQAEAKFIDLSTTDKDLITNTGDIILRLEGMGFHIEDRNAWQYHLIRDNESVAVTKCPFNGKYESLPVRDVFVSPNGILYRSYGGHLEVDALNEIKSRDVEGLVKKVEVLL